MLQFSLDSDFQSQPSLGMHQIQKVGLKDATFAVWRTTNSDQVSALDLTALNRSTRSGCQTSLNPIKRCQNWSQLAKNPEFSVKSDQFSYLLIVFSKVRQPLRVERSKVVKSIKQWNSPENCNSNEIIHNIAYNSGTLALIIVHTPCNIINIELRSSTTFDRIWSLPLDLTRDAAQMWWVAYNRSQNFAPFSC